MKNYGILNAANWCLNAKFVNEMDPWLFQLVLLHLSWYSSKIKVVVFIPYLPPLPLI